MTPGLLGGEKLSSMEGPGKVCLFDPDSIAFTANLDDVRHASGKLLGHAKMEKLVWPVGVAFGPEDPSDDKLGSGKHVGEHAD